MDRASLEILNPWWQNPRKIAEDEHLLVRSQSYYFDNPLKSEIPLQPGSVTILRGPRQVGKTTLMKEKIAEALVAKTFAPENCVFMSRRCLLRSGQRVAGAAQSEKNLFHRSFALCHCRRLFAGYPPCSRVVGSNNRSGWHAWAHFRIGGHR